MTCLAAARPCRAARSRLGRGAQGPGGRPADPGCWPTPTATARWTARCAMSASAPTPSSRWRSTTRAGCVRRPCARRWPRRPTRPSSCCRRGELNLAAFDPFEDLAPIARAAGAWTHVDGAFGLWAKASPKHRHLVRGLELCDSWTTDGHKYLNVPYDSGLGLRPRRGGPPRGDDALHQLPAGGRRGARRHRLDPGVLAPGARLRGLCGAPGTGPRGGSPSWSSAPAATPTHRHGHRRHAGRRADRRLGVEPGPGAVRRRRPHRRGDRRRQRDRRGLLRRVTWRGRRAMRISVCNWRTTDADVARTLAAVREIVDSVK